MKKFLSILFFSFITHFSYAQTFTQTFTDRCTGEVQVVTANFQTGSAVVSFYDRVRVFTYQEYINGQLQSWLLTTYAWYQALSPCSQAEQQAQQAQQAANNAVSAASYAANSTTNSTTNATSNTTGGTTSTDISSGGTTESTSTDTSSSTESSSGENSGGNGEGESGGGEETSSETSESESEGGETESESEESSEESSSEEESEKEEKKKKKREMMPIQLKADLMAQQSLLGTFSPVLNFGLSQSSIFGDVNYGANLMVWGNLSQASLSLNRSKVTLNDSYEAKWVDATSVSYMRSYRMNAVAVSLSRMKPMGKWGTAGIGINYSTLFGKDTFGESMSDIYSLGWNVLYTNSFQLSDRINYAPAIIGMQNPMSFTNQIDDAFSTISKDFMGILSNSFTVQLTRRFSFNVGWTLIYSTNEYIPIMNSIMIGSKIPF